MNDDKEEADAVYTAIRSKRFHTLAAFLQCAQKLVKTIVLNWLHRRWCRGTG
jgi:hypothetical protein